VRLVVFDLPQQLELFRENGFTLNGMNRLVHATDWLTGRVDPGPFEHQAGVWDLLADLVNGEIQSPEPGGRLGVCRSTVVDQRGDAVRIPQTGQGYDSAVPVRYDQADRAWGTARLGAARLLSRLPDGPSGTRARRAVSHLVRCVLFCAVSADAATPGLIQTGFVGLANHNTRQEWRHCRVGQRPPQSDRIPSQSFRVPTEDHQNVDLSTDAWSGEPRCIEPSNLAATSWRYQPRMVSGLARGAIMAWTEMGGGGQIDRCKFGSVHARRYDRTAGTACRLLA
jgi:hypothetical protein